MIDLPTLALQFTRSCLGWPSPEFDQSLTGRKYIQQLDRNGFDKLYYEELGSVLEFVREWCDGRGIGIKIEYSPSQKGYGVFCEGVDTWDRDLAVAVMTVCLGVEAPRVP